MPPARKPWPMKWVVLAIVAFIVPYTYLTLHFRKPGPGYLPYEDARQRAVLAKAGYARISLRPQWPSDPPALAFDVAIHSAPGGLPEDLRQSLAIEPPLLASRIDAVEAGSSLGPTEPYRIRFAATLPDNREVLADAKLYYRPGFIYIVPNCERLTGDLQARARSAVTVLEVQPGSIPAGTYRATLVGAQSAKAWTLQVH